MSFNLDGSSVNSNVFSNLYSNYLYTNNINPNSGSSINVNSNLNFNYWYGLQNINSINPSPNSPLVIDDLNNNTQVQINHTLQPGLIITQTGDYPGNWINLACSNYEDDNSFVCGSLQGQTTFGSHNRALNQWKDLYCQFGANFNVGSTNNVEKFNVAGNIRTDSGSFFIGNVNQFRYPKTKTICTQQITISSTSDTLLTQFIYLGSNSEGLITKIYAAVNSNNSSSMTFFVKDEFVNLTLASLNDNNGVLNVRDFGTISNISTVPTVISIYGRLNSAGTG